MRVVGWMIPALVTSCSWGLVKYLQPDAGTAWSIGAVSMAVAIFVMDLIGRRS